METYLGPGVNLKWYFVGFMLDCCDDFEFEFIYRVFYQLPDLGLIGFDFGSSDVSGLGQVYAYKIAVNK